MTFYLSCEDFWINSEKSLHLNILRIKDRVTMIMISLFLKLQDTFPLSSGISSMVPQWQETSPKICPEMESSLPPS